MIRLSEKLGTLIIRSCLDSNYQRNDIMSHIDPLVNSLYRLYVGKNVRYYFSPQPEFLKQCKL